LTNIVLYQVGWFVSVLAAARHQPWVGAGVGIVLVLAHVFLVADRRSEIRTLVAAMVVGTIVESAQASLGLFTYTSGYLVPTLAPPWIVILWAQFATTFRHSVRWLMGRPVLAAMLGAAGGPLACLAGERLGAVRFSPPTWHGLVWLAVVYGIAVPLLLAIARAADGEPTSR
jgi:Protein of unknown function (DUF2878)